MVKLNRFDYTQYVLGKSESLLRKFFILGRQVFPKKRYSIRKPISNKDLKVNYPCRSYSVPVSRIHRQRQSIPYHRSIGRYPCGCQCLNQILVSQFHMLFSKFLCFYMESYFLHILLKCFYIKRDKLSFILIYLYNISFNEIQIHDRYYKMLLHSSLVNPAGLT